MSFVSYEDFQLRYENIVPAADEERVSVFLEDACALAEDVVGTSYEGSSGVPQIVIATVCKAVRRAYENPDGLQGETIGDYSWRVGAAAESGLYFTPSEARIMRRAATRSGVGTLELEGILPNSLGDGRYVSDAGSPLSPVLYHDWSDLP